MRSYISINDFYYNPSNKTIVYNPKSGLEITTGGKQTPALGFLHEVAHALQHIQNPMQFFKDANTSNVNYDNLEEKRVINKIETPAAKKAGESIRKDHGGTPYKVIGPASIIKDEEDE